MIGTLGNLNYQIFISDKTSTSIWRVTVRYHQKSLRLPKELPTTMVGTYYQITLWSLIDSFELEATDCEVITTVTTDKEIAPELLTKVIRCNCKVCMCEI